MAPERPQGADAMHARSRPNWRFPAQTDPSAPPRPGSVPLYAALDLGTNSCRMLIAQPQGQSVSGRGQLFQDRAAGRRAGSLGPAVAGRRWGARFRRCGSARRRSKSTACTRMRLVATEACRRARNARDFIRQVRRETGLTLEIIAAEEEARLAVISCAPLVNATTEQLLVVDIGGGSTELVWIDLSAVAPEDRPARDHAAASGFQRPGPSAMRGWWTGFRCRLGVATLKDQFGDVEDDAARFALMSWFFEENLAAFRPITPHNPRAGFQIIGTSGHGHDGCGQSFLGLRRYDRTKVDGLQMTSDQIDLVIREYLSLGPEGRRTDPRIGRDRHTLIMSGAAILQALMRIWPTDQLVCGRPGSARGAALCTDERGWRSGRRAVRMTEKNTSGPGPARAARAGQDRQGAQAVVHAVAGAAVERSLCDPRQERGLSGPGGLQDPGTGRQVRVPEAGRAGGRPWLCAGGLVSGCGGRVNALGEKPNKPVGTVLGVDLQEIEPIAGAEIHQLDFLAEGADGSGQGLAGWQGRCGDVGHGGGLVGAQGHRPSAHHRAVRGGGGVCL